MPPPNTPDQPVLRVLLVEDHDRMRAILSTRLTSALHADVTAVPDIPTGLDELLNRSVDVVLMDVHVAGRSAVDALPHVRATAPSARVVLMSAEVTETLIRAGRAGGADAVVAKSAGLDALCLAVVPEGAPSRP